MRKIFFSRKFLFFNLILLGIIAGFTIAMISFSCSTRLADGKNAKGTGPAGLALAQEKPDLGIEALRKLQSGFRSVAKAVLPVVVEITTVETRKQTLPEQDPFNLMPWDFGPFGTDEPPGEREFQNQGLGSGILVHRDRDTAYVITNNHVIGNADEINVTLFDKREFRAELVGNDQRKDLALLSFKTNDETIIPAVLGDSDFLEVGDWVLAIGNPFGYISSVTAGIVSAKGRRGPQDNISDFIQTDSSINQGNSGGALVNLDGQVVGINTWITTPTGGSIGLGFAIPINNVKKAINDFIAKGEVEYEWLGVSIADPLPLIVDNLDLKKTKGAFVYHVFKGSPADKGGILPGDYITSINGREIEDSDELVRIVGDLPPKKNALFSLLRFGSRFNAEVAIGLREDAAAITAQSKNLWPGITVVPLSKDFIKDLKIPEDTKGLLVSEVERNTKPYLAGIKAGDVISALNAKKIINLVDFYNIINDKNIKDLKFTVLRNGEEFSFGIAP
ncbi:MAG: Do family serine endopeptidase [Spirochaetales bacterium]|nr:MAG: Do family serine endopeptidase [Spirochaetales bacterium]